MREDVANGSLFRYVENAGAMRALARRGRERAPEDILRRQLASYRGLRQRAALCNAAVRLHQGPSAQPMTCTPRVLDDPKLRQPYSVPAAARLAARQATSALLGGSAGVPLGAPAVGDTHDRNAAKVM